MMTLEKYSMGCGDRFGRQAASQLAAFEKIAADGIDVTPVWNKSNREHEIIGTSPQSVRDAAQAAVTERGWNKAWRTDADHISLNTVDAFISSSDFFTLDVADAIGGPVDESEVDRFLKARSDLMNLQIPGLGQPLEITPEQARQIARQYLPAIRTASEIYKKIAGAKGEGNFITEVSMDETDTPQGPAELLLILAAAADYQIPVQTIAPRFCGRFNKGVEYQGDPSGFAAEFGADILVVRYAAERFGLPRNLKLSVHSGSDKFAIYPKIKELTAKHGAGFHLKTAGTTWLEEIIGLAEAGGSGLKLAQDVYSQAHAKKDALCAPYAEVIDIDDSQLPAPETVSGWDADTFVRTLRHDSADPLYNLGLRQLIHVGYKVAAQMGKTYLDALAEHRESVSRNVTHNLYARHMKNVFPAV